MEKPEKTLLTVNEVANLIGESVHVVRNWLREFKDYISIEKAENGYNLFDEEAVSVMRTIQRLHRDQKFSVRQIEHYLSTGGKEFGPAPVPQLPLEDLTEIKDALRRQEAFNQALLERLDKQQQYIEKSIGERDQQLMHVLREIQEKKALPDPRRWWEFWREK